MPGNPQLRREAQAAITESRTRMFLFRVITGLLCISAPYPLLVQRVDCHGNGPWWASQRSRQEAAGIICFGEFATRVRLAAMLKEKQISVDDLRAFLQRAKNWLQLHWIERINGAIEDFEGVGVKFFPEQPVVEIVSRRAQIPPAASVVTTRELKDLFGELDELLKVGDRR